MNLLNSFCSTVWTPYKLGSPYVAVEGCSHCCCQNFFFFQGRTFCFSNHAEQHTNIPSCRHTQTHSHSRHTQTLSSQRRHTQTQTLIPGSVAQSSRKTRRLEASSISACSVCTVTSLVRLRNWLSSTSSSVVLGTLVMVSTISSKRWQMLHTSTEHSLRYSPHSQARPNQLIRAIGPDHWWTPKQRAFWGVSWHGNPNPRATPDALRKRQVMSCQNAFIRPVYIFAECSPHCRVWCSQFHWL